MIRASLLSLSDKSTGDVFGNVDVDYATGSFCSSCSIPPPEACGFCVSKNDSEPAHLGGDFHVVRQSDQRPVLCAGL